MSYTYTGYSPAYGSYSTFSPGRTYTTTYGHPAPVTTTSYVGGSTFYSPGRTYTTSYAPTTSYVHHAPVTYGSPYGSTVTYSPGYGGVTRTSYGLGNTYTTTYY